MSYNTIVLQGTGRRFEAVVTTGQTITPGMLVKLQSDGTVRTHSAAGQVAERAFAVEDDLQGKVITDAYASASLCQYEILNSGDVAYLPIANGEDIAVGDFLQSDGAGKLDKYVADSAGVVEYPLSIIGVAMDALDLSGAVNAGSIRVRIMG